jgi:DNA-binding transcriptional ArsR family regulator
MQPEEEPHRMATREAPGRERDRAMTLLGEVLSSRVRATVLAWAVPRLETPFSLTELSRAVDAPISSLQHECYKLERLGVLRARREGGSRRYRVQLEHRLARPLVGLVVATLGLETVLADALDGAGDIHTAFLTGAGEGDPVGELLLVLIGEAGLEGLDRAQRRVSLLLGRDADGIELAYFQADDWDAQDAGHPFRRRLAGRPIQPIVSR